MPSLRCSRRCFNPRPRKGATMPVPSPCPASCRFNPRPRKGGDLKADRSIFIAMLVSIHAPARGATQTVCVGEVYFQVSIHAPARGGDSRCRCSASVRSCFNSRPRKGGDAFWTYLYDHYNVFQFTPPQGGRRSAACRAPACSCFNPRPHEGGRHYNTHVMAAELGFNPRPHEGGDGRADGAPDMYMFQSTPPRGGRPS